MAKKVAIITGGGQGIGEGIAKRLSKDGYAVIINGRTQSKLDKVADEIKKDGGQALTFAGDVSSRQVNVDLIKKAEDEFGRLDVFVANAGIDWVDNIEETPEDAVDQVIDINL